MTTCWAWAKYSHFSRCSIRIQWGDSVRLDMVEGLEVITYCVFLHCIPREHHYGSVGRSIDRSGDIEGFFRTSI